MRIPKSCLKTVLVCVGLCAVLVPGTVFAQADHTMEFGVDETEQDKSDKGTQKTGQGDETRQLKSNSVMVLAVAPSSLDRGKQRLADRLESGIEKHKPDKKIVGRSSIRSELEVRNLSECVTQPLCLAELGRKAGSKQILVGRVDERQGQLVLNVERFNVPDTLFTGYAPKVQGSDFESLLTQVPDAVRRAYGIEKEVEEQTYVDPKKGASVQTLLAWTTAGLAVLAAGAGGFVGVQVSRDEQALRGSQQNGQYQFTQKQAQKEVRQLESQATLANVLYGAAGGMAVLSTILFIAQPDDVARPRESVSGPNASSQLQLNPRVAPGRVGFGLDWRF